MRILQGMGLGLFIAVAVAALAAFGTTLAQDSTPVSREPLETYFTYQGRLEVDGVPANGNYTIIVQLWDSPAGGNMLSSSATEMDISNGLFSMLVNAGDDMNGERRWVQALVSANPSDIPIGPRQELTPVAYAFYAKEAGSLSSEAAAGFIQNGTGVQPTSNFHISGNGIADGAIGASKYQLGGQDFAYTFGTSASGLAIGPGAGNGPNGTLFNLFVGEGAGGSISSGNQNLAVGAGALGSTSTGEANTAIGTSALASNSSGSGNVGVGNQALYNSQDTGNTGVGLEALFEATSGKNTALGYRAGRHFTTGTENVFIGSEAGRGVWPDSTGSQNVAVGTEAGYALRAGSGNSLFGDRAGRAITSGAHNTLLGRNAGLAQTDAADNVVIGHDAGKANVSGSQNVYLGRLAGNVATGGINTFVGFNAGGATTSGEQNLFLGYETGYGNTTGSYNTALGASATFSANNLEFATAVGAYAQATASNQVQLGRNGTDTVRIGTLGTGAIADVCMNNSNVLSDCLSSSLRYKTNLADYTGGLDVLEQLRPVTFDWKSDGSHDLGFVAEDVAAIDPLLATYRDGQVEGVKYDRISAVLVNSVMEQQAQIDALATGVAPETGNAIEERLTALESESGQPWLLLAGVVAVALAAGAAGGYATARVRS